ncbi:MAG: 4-hydroxy-tetrahydrodipicolinate reductase [Bacteroidetes bacterium]|nr:4-hydroxy-tetrahydrodipicolinate reductase [Bacteroidota bacterium]
MNPLRLGLLGYGKMGRAVEAALHAQRLGESAVAPNSAAALSLAWTLDAGVGAAALQEAFQQVDVVIEFSRPEAAVDNIVAALEAGTAIVVGTTGWYEHLPKVREACLAHSGAVLYAPNFSIGVNLFMAIQEYAAQLFARYPRYQVSLSETHHTAKLDAPSGTAIHLAQSVIDRHPGYQRWALQEEPFQEPGQGVLPIEAHREAQVPGTHQLRFSSPEDTILLEHVAHNREGFARGALDAARWLPGRQGLFTLRDMMEQGS